MQNDSAYSDLSTLIHFLSTVFGEYIVHAKLKRISEVNPLADNKYKIEKLKLEFSVLSPFVINSSETQNKNNRIDTPVHDDIQSISVEKLYPTHTSDWLEGISGKSLNEQTIQINPRF